MKHISESIIGKRGSAVPLEKIDTFKEKMNMEWTNLGREFMFTIDGSVKGLQFTRVSITGTSEVLNRFKDYPVIYVYPQLFRKEIGRYGFMIVAGAKTETGPKSHDLKIEIYDSDHNTIIYSDCMKDHVTGYIELRDICEKGYGS